MVSATLTSLLILWVLLAQPESAGGSTFHAPDATSLFKILLRWLHFLAGITWIGLLYFFNLVNVNFMKALDAQTKGKVVPELMPPALWWFRWGAVVTVLVGFTYYAMYIVAADARNAGMNTWGILGWFLLVWIVAFVIDYVLLLKVDKGPVLAVLMAILVIAASWVIIALLGAPSENPDRLADTLSNKSLSIGIGGGIGIIMLLNVWGIIWPAQKRIIAGTKEGTAVPPELARRAFLASRTNTWLSLPMLFFMATSHGDYIWFAK